MLRLRVVAAVAVFGVAVVSPISAGGDGGSLGGRVFSPTLSGSGSGLTTASTGAAAGLQGATTRASVATGGAQPMWGVWDGGSISADGRYVAFSSDSSDLVPSDTNDVRDVFVRDRRSGTTTRVSVATDGRQTNWGSDQPAISADGRYIAFVSEATHLVSGDTNGVGDIFLRDQVAGTTVRVSVTSSGGQAGSDSWRSAISGDGRYVAFHSQAANLVPNDTNGESDYFVHDRVTGTTTLVSTASEGTQAQGDDYAGGAPPALSRDGRYITFSSAAANLVSGDTNNTRDVFVHDRVTGDTTRASTSSGGAQGDLFSDAPSISSDGRYLAFESMATNLVDGDINNAADVFIRDTATRATTLVSVATDGSQGNGGSGPPVLSADGLHLAFTSNASNLVPADTNQGHDEFIRDLVAGTTERVNVGANDAQADGFGCLGGISSDGRYVAFSSNAEDLVPGDTNFSPDIFVRDRFAPTTPFGDLDSDGWADLVARQVSTGYLFLYPGAGNAFAPRVRVGTGWNAMTTVTRLGDFNRDGREDLLAVRRDTGSLWLYPGNGKARFTAPIKLGSRGWNGMRELTAAGDLTGDGFADLLAVQTSTGNLYVYPGHGTSLAARRLIGTGWNAMSELAGAGDFNGDGHVDLIARRNSTGTLWLYPGTGSGTLGARALVGARGWNSMSAITGVGDFDRDGNTDLIAVDSATGRLYLYPGARTRLAPRQLLGTGWTNNYAPLL